MIFNAFLLNLIFVSSTVVKAFVLPDDIQFNARVARPKTTNIIQRNENHSRHALPPPFFSIHSPHKSHLFMAKADRGTRVIAKAPILKNWSKNADGSITANIFNSPDFRNNEKVTTSRIVDRTLKSGQLVTSVSGSKYRLEGSEFPLQKKGTFSVGNNAKLAKGTFSVQNAKFGPKGIPTLRKWRQNKDGSISGRIFGSKGFKENEFVTTSPMMGEPVANSVARTISGSRYYLEGNGSLAKKVTTRSTGTRSVKGESKGLGSILSGVIALAAATFFGFNAFQGPSVNNVVGDTDSSVSSLSTNDMKASTSKPPAPIEFKLEMKDKNEEVDRLNVENRDGTHVEVETEKKDSQSSKEDFESRNKGFEAERLRVEAERKELERLKAMELERLKVEEERARAEDNQKIVKDIEQMIDTEVDESEISSEVQEIESEFGFNSSARNVLTGISATAALSIAVAVSVANQNSGYGREEKETTRQSPSPVSTQKDLMPIGTQRGPSSTVQSSYPDKPSSGPAVVKSASVNKKLPSDSSLTYRDEQISTQPSTSQKLSTYRSNDVISTTTTSTTSTRSTTRSSYFVGEPSSETTIISTNNTCDQGTQRIPTLDEVDEVQMCSIEMSTQTKVEASIENSVESYCEKFVEEICDKMNYL